jgi:hypothetical protein
MQPDTGADSETRDDPGRSCYRKRRNRSLYKARVDAESNQILDAPLLGTGRASRDQSPITILAHGSSGQSAISSGFHL